MNQLEWFEARAKFHNLKTKPSQNTLEEDDVSKLWIPKLVYENNKDNFHTRADMMEASLFVKRIGNFTRSGVEIVDEIEVFNGDQNPIIMIKSQTKDFKCQFKLEMFPFDTQVRRNNIMDRF